MFDNLREQPDSTPFYEEEDLFRDAEEVRPSPPPKPKKISANGKFLGMTPAQRFVLALMLFITVCVLGAMLLIVTGRIGLM